MTDSIHKHPCSVEGCDKSGRRLDPNLKDEAGKPLKVNKGGKIYCEPHFRRLKEYGSPTAGPEIRRGRVKVRGGECSVEGCTNEVWARGICVKHQVREYRAQHPSSKKEQTSVDA